MRVRDPSSSSGAGIQQRLFFRWPLGLVRPWRSVGPPRLMRQVGARLSCTTLARRWHGYQPRRIPCPLRCLPATPQKIALGRCRRSSALCPEFLNPYGRVASGVSRCHGSRATNRVSQPCKAHQPQRTPSAQRVIECARSRENRRVSTFAEIRGLTPLGSPLAYVAIHFAASVVASVEARRTVVALVRSGRRWPNRPSQRSSTGRDGSLDVSGFARAPRHRWWPAR
jgi:hypothetical protein